MSKRFFIIYDVSFTEEQTKESVQGYACTIANHLTGNGASWFFDAAGEQTAEKFEDSKTAARIKHAPVEAHKHEWLYNNAGKGQPKKRSCACGVTEVWTQGGPPRKRTWYWAAK